MPNTHPTIIAVDTETTRLTRPYLRNGRRIWDLAVVRRDSTGVENQLQVFVRLVDLGLLEMIPARVAMDITTPITERLRSYLPGDVVESLDIGRFWDRHPEICEPDNPNPPVLAEKQVAELLMSGWLGPGPELGKPVMVGVVPEFDDLGLHDLLYRHKWIGSDTPWHYHKADMDAMLAGALRVPPPWSSDALSRGIGVDPAAYPRHTALGDAQWALDLYDAVFRNDPGAPPRPPEEPEPESAEPEPAAPEPAEQPAEPGEAA